MFEHFTFGAQAQNSCQDEVAPSPTDTSCIPAQQPSTSCPLPDTAPANLAINDLLEKMDHQTLVPEDAEISTMYTDTLVCPAFEDAYAEDVELSFMSSRRGLTKLRTRPDISPESSSSVGRGVTGISARRLQRQLNTQLQCSTSHVKDITNLVQDMVASRDQCIVHEAPTTSPTSPPPSSTTDTFAPSPSPTEPASPATPVDAGPPTPPEDEGFDELDDDEAMDLMIAECDAAIEAEEYESLYSEGTSLRKASTPSGIRRSYLMRYGLYKTCSNVELSRTNSDGINEYMPREPGRQKVRRLPRMRVREKLCEGKGKGKERVVSNTVQSLTSST